MMLLSLTQYAVQNFQAAQLQKTNFLTLLLIVNIQISIGECPYEKNPGCSFPKIDYSTFLFLVNIQISMSILIALLQVVLA